MLTSKKEARLLSKKRKLEALAMVSNLNESDRENGKNGSNSSSENDDDKKNTGPSATEPQSKRSKNSTNETEQQIASTDNSDHIISTEDYKQLKAELNKKKRELKNIPKIRLKLFGENAALSIGSDIRTPIFVTDIQHLIMFTLFGSTTPCVPSRWCHLEKASKVSHTVVVAVDGLSLFHYSSYESLFENCTNIFENKLEVVTPQSTKEGEHFINELITVPCTALQRAELIKKYGSLEAALDSTQDPVLLVKSVFPVEQAADEIVNSDENSAKPARSTTEVFPRTQLLLSALQMVDEGYPLPLRGELANRYKDFVLTKDAYKEVTANSPMYGLDCEMCRTSSGANELTRISIVNENQDSIYETLVCPKNKIVDYLTHFSGITPEIMKNVTKTLAEVQEDVRNILPDDAILVGQSLQSDLMAMRMMHPYVIDTSIIFNLSGDRRRKSKLQTLSSEFLGESIQKNPLGHDSIEDCSASLKLTKLKLCNGIDFGDAILANRRRFHERAAEMSTSPKDASVAEDNQPAPNDTETGTNQKDRSTAVISSDESNTIDYQTMINNKFVTNGDAGNVTKDDNLSSQANIKFFRNSNNKLAVENTCQAAINYALTLTHLQVKESRLDDDKIEKTLRKFDRWIGSIWESIAPKGLLIVLLGGNAPGAASGVALIQVK